MSDPHPSSPSRRAFLAATSAACLGACASPARMTARAVAQWPPEGRFAQVEGLRVHYVQTGPAGGPSAVLIHGAGLSLRDMTFMTAWRLGRAGFRVTAFDRPGSGYSDRAPVEGWRPATQARILRAAADGIGAADGATLLGHG